MSADCALWGHPNIDGATMRVLRHRCNGPERDRHLLAIGADVAQRIHRPACSVEGCERPAYARGWCTAHYERWMDHGDVFADRRLRMYGRTEVERFWNRVVISVDGCWEWDGARNAKGYGSFDKIDSAHRYAYKLLVGPIPEGLQLDHLCRNPPCVRPDHLEPVTPGENTRRGKRASQTHCLNGHPFAGENLLVTKRGQRQCRECAKARMARFNLRRASR